MKARANCFSAKVGPLEASIPEGAEVNPYRYGKRAGFAPKPVDYIVLRSRPRKEKRFLCTIVAQFQAAELAAFLEQGSKAVANLIRVDPAVSAFIA